MIRTTVAIEGMMCPMCEKRVNEAIENAFDVKEVISSNEKNETVIVSKKAITLDEVKKVIDPIGYEVKGLERIEC